MPFTFEINSNYEKRKLRVLGLPEKFNPKTNIFEDKFGLNDFIFRDKIVESNEYSGLLNEKTSNINKTENKNNTQDNKDFENFKKIFIENQYISMGGNDFLILRCIGVNRKPLVGYYNSKFNINEVLPIGYSDKY